MSFTLQFTRDDVVDLVNDLNELLTVSDDDMDDETREDIMNIVDTLPEVLHLL